MRLGVAITLAVLAPSGALVPLEALAAPASRTEAITGASPAFRDRQAEIEARSKAAMTDQAARDARFDASVRRATGSICTGCFAPPARSAAPRPRGAAE